MRTAYVFFTNFLALAILGPPLLIVTFGVWILKRCEK